MIRLTESIEQTLPTPLSDAYLVFINESDSQPFRKVHRLIDLIEVFCKLYTTASMATFLNVLKSNIEKEESSLNEALFTKIKVMLSAGLKTPSLGIWWKFARDITSILDELHIPHILPGAEKELLHKNSSIKKAFDGENNLISFRNKYAHGATPSDDLCTKDLNEVWPRMLQLFEDAVSLQKVKLVICTSESLFFEIQAQTLLPFKGEMPVLKGHSWFCSENNYVDAFPILSFKINKDNVDFFFYNDLKDKFANYLNYPNADHFKDADLKDELLQLIPIDEWKKISTVEMDPFRQQVEMLTEVFKGRKEELKEIATFIRNDENRFLCIWGPPGVGKSALLARSTQILRYDLEVREMMEDATDWPENKVFLVEYFIRRGATDNASSFFDSLNQRLDQLFQLRIDYGKTDDEKKAFFQVRLQYISKQLKGEEQLLFIIDGLDEIKKGDSLLQLLPSLLPEKIKIVYGARPQQDLRFTFYEQLDRERRTQFDLGGLKLNDIRALLMEHVSKYEMLQSFVEEVLKSSDGNPLYLKLLCSGLEQGVYELNQTFSLPNGMDELYEAALLRLEKEFPGAIQFLVFLAAAKDFASPEMLAEWLEISTPSLRNNLLYACLEFLYENPQTKYLDDYQLFHESLREYLSKTYKKELTESQERICDWSLKWKLPNGDIGFQEERLTYAMRFSIEHLFESYLIHLEMKRIGSAEERRTHLFTLTESEDWRALNFETCGNGEAIGKGYYYLQRVLVKEDVSGAKLDDFFRYAYSRYNEPIRMYGTQRNLLLNPVGKEKLSAHFERIPSLAKMGQRDEDKVLLALLPLWANDSRGDKIPAVLEENILEWLENTRNSAVKKLWERTKKLM